MIDQLKNLLGTRLTSVWVNDESAKEFSPTGMGCAFVKRFIFHLIIQSSSLVRMLHVPVPGGASDFTGMTRTWHSSSLATMPSLLNSLKGHWRKYQN